MNPAGGIEAAGSHWRSGPELVSGRTLAKLQGGGTAPATGIHPMSRVNLNASKASEHASSGDAIRRRQRRAPEPSLNAEDHFSPRASCSDSEDPAHGAPVK